MNDEQKNNVEGTETPNIQNPTPSIIPNTEEEMTTAVVNPNFMQEVEPEPTPAVETPKPVEAVANEPEITEPVATDPGNLEPKKKKGINKIVLIVIIVIAVILVAIGAYACYQFIGVNPKKVHDKVIDQMFAGADKFANSLTVNYNSDAKTMKSNSKITFNTNVDGYEMINDYSINFNSGLDKAGNYGNFELELLEKGKGLVKANYLLLDNKMYLDTDAYDEVLLIGDYEINVENLLDSYGTLDNQNISYLLENLKNGIKKSFDEGKYERKLEDVKLNGKTVKAFNNSYVIDEASYYSMLKSVINNLKNDDKALEILADMINGIASSSMLSDMENTEFSDTTMLTVKKEDVATLLDNLIKELSDPELSGSNEKIYFNVYTSMITNDVVGVKLIANDGSQNINLIEYSVDGDTSKFRLAFDEAGTIVYESVSKNDTTEFKLILQNQTLLTGASVMNDKRVELTLKLDLSSFMGGTTSMSITVGIVSESKDNGSKVELKLAAEQGGQTEQVIINVDNTITYNESITKPSVNNSIPIEEADEEKMAENIMKAFEGSGLENYIKDYYEKFSPVEEDKPNDVEYSEHCDEAKNCKCDDSVSGICSCKYLNDDWDYEDIICPNPNI